MRINKIHFPITTLGYGRRVGIWTQGCSIRCPGCISRDTWETNSSSEIEISALVSTIQPWLAQADGVTISGGEPFDQPKALQAFLVLLRPIFAGDILIFSGYSHQKLFAEHSELLKSVDVLISEPFDSRAGQTLALRGSDNQRIFLMTEVAKSRYPADINQQSWANRNLDAVLDDDTLWMAGIPATGTMKKLRHELARRGFDCHTSDQPPLIRA